VYLRRLLHFDFIQNPYTEFQENPTNCLDAHTRSWPRIKQTHQHCYLFIRAGYVCDNRYLVSTARLYGFKNTTNKSKNYSYSQRTRRPHGKSTNSSAEADFRERLFFRRIEVIFTVRDLRLSQWRRRFKSSGMLRRVDWHIVTDLPNDRCVFETSVTTYQSTQTFRLQSQQVHPLV
jgi:hypothetical protein